MHKRKVGFIGGGQMAAALITGALERGFLEPSDLLIVESAQLRREQLGRLFPKVSVHAAATAAAECDPVVVAVKPGVLREIGSSLGQVLPGNRLWVSIAAGVSIAELQDMLNATRVIRIMPNTPAQVGAGAAALSACTDVEDRDIAWARQLMESVGTCVTVPEWQLHGVTGIAGSSPAYVYIFIEALADAGVSAGLAREVALQLAAQAVLGSAKMVLATGQHPGQLKDQVTSPGGTTIAALRKLEAAGLRSAVIEAVAACVERSRQLEQFSA
ncbi:MAG: pyrroline-5-carboxylate reductase [Pirellulaceae bacterium]|nr:pyrroline-5-carboxylate reductase [Pirellulaceae bacterium]